MNQLREASMLGIPKTMKDNSVEFHLSVGGHIYAAGIDFEEGEDSNPILTIDKLAGEALRFYIAHKKNHAND